MVAGQWESTWRCAQCRCCFSGSKRSDIGLGCSQLLLTFIHNVLLLYVPPSQPGCAQFPFADPLMLLREEDLDPHSQEYKKHRVCLWTD